RFRVSIDARGLEISQVCDRTRTTVDRDLLVLSIQSIFRTAITTCRILHDFDVEFRFDGISGEISRWPGPSDADQAALEQQRMRFGLALLHVRAIGTVPDIEQRCLAIRFFPKPLDRIERQAHAIARLMTGHT